jgi:SAM-dependent methyltransferase
MPLSEVLNPGRYEDPEWMRIHRDLESYSPDKHVFRHTGDEIYRKGWEWTQAAYGLSRLGAITERSTGLGVGTGHEAIIFWLADRCRNVVATDLYGNTTWSSLHGREADQLVLTDPRQFCTRDFAADRVLFTTANGCDLPFDSNVFDFCWSLSSIEHFGGHDASAQAVSEMGRVVRPGGIVCVATEYLLLPEQTHPEFFNRDQMERCVIGASPDLSLVDGMSWELPPLEFLIDQICFIGDAVHRRRRHVVLNDGNVQWTSLMVFLRKR